jgi:integrase
VVQLALELLYRPRGAFVPSGGARRLHVLARAKAFALSKLAAAFAVLNDAYGYWSCTPVAGSLTINTSAVRRTFATWMANMGVPENVLVARMGHTSSKMIRKVYARLQPASETPSSRRRIRG